MSASRRVLGEVGVVDTGAPLAVAEPAGPEVPPSARAQRWALARLALVIALGVILAVVFHVAGTVVVVAAIVAMIVLHEAGHFVMAKLGGMKVTEFFVGFGPRVWSFRRGETTYGVKALPLGGYVRVVGMTNLEPVAPADEARSYRRATFPRRLGVALAGSATHLLLALVLAVALNAIWGPTDPHRVEVVGYAPLPAGVNNPARSAGIRPGDVVLSAAGRPVHSFASLASVIDSHPDEPLRLGIERHGRRRTVVATPIDDAGMRVDGQLLSPAGHPEGFLGIELEHPRVPLGIGASVVTGAEDLGSAMAGTVSILGHLVSPSGIRSYVHTVVNPTTKPATHTSSPPVRLLSPVGVVQVAADAAHSGAEDVLVLLFSINVFVGLFNLFPMLPFDGGHVVIALYERLRSSKRRRYHADVGKLVAPTYVVISALTLLFLSALFLDVTHPIANPFH
jgi:membrane-associated protease RseP (regulator of RpoE activity)